MEDVYNTVEELDTKEYEDPDYFYDELGRVRRTERKMVSWFEILYGIVEEKWLEVDFKSDRWFLRAVFWTVFSEKLSVRKLLRSHLLSKLRIRLLFSMKNNEFVQRLSNI